MRRKNCLLFFESFSYRNIIFLKFQASKALSKRMGEIEDEVDMEMSLERQEMNDLRRCIIDQILRLNISDKT